MSLSFTHLLFDLDGVLLDTERLYTEATQRVVGEFGKSFGWALKSRMMGREALEAARELVSTLDLPISAEEYLLRQRPIAEELFTRSTELSGAEAFVRALAARGVPLAVATSSSARMLRLKTSHHAWFSLFGAIVCADHPEVRTLKPAPDIFLAAARELEAEPSSCLVLEDSIAGVQAARNAGMRVIALPDAALDASAFAHADHVVRSYAELRALLGI